MKRPGRLISLVALGVAAAASSCAPKTPTYAIHYAEMRAKIDNGLRMVIIPDDTTPMVHVAVRYQVGANEDPPGKAGLAHLVEHMMFQHRLLGPDKPATFELLPQIATGFNAWTNWDTTHYYDEGRKEDLDKMLRIEAARMGAMCKTIPEPEFEREREVVRNEIRQRQGTPEGQVPGLMLAEVYPPGHAYHYMVGGNDQQLASIKFQDVCDFMRKYYTPSRATVVVAGNVGSPEEVGAKIKAAFGGIPARTPAARKPVAPLGELTYQKEVKEVDTERSQVIVMWKLPPRSSDDYAAGQTMVGAVSSRLAYFNDQYDFAASIGAGPFGGERAPVMVVSAELYNYNDAGKVLDWIWKVTSQIHRGFDDGMFSEDVAAIGKARIIGGIENLAQRATFVADQVQFEPNVDFSGNKEYLIHALERYDKLDGGKFRAFMKGALSKKHAKVLIIKSSKNGIRGDKRAALSYSTRTHTKDITPVVNPAEAKHPLPAPETDSVLKNAIHYQLGNGMKVVLLPTNGMPMVTSGLMFRVGSAQEPANKAGLANVAAGFLHPPLGATFTQVGVGFGGFAGKDTTTFYARGVNIYLGVLIKGLERILKAGEISQDAVERWQHFEKLQFESAEFRRNRTFRLEIAKAIYGPEHPYTITGSPTQSSYKRIGRDVAMDWVRKHYSAKNATLIVVGNFDAEQAKKAISGSFGNWSGGHEDKAVAPDAMPRTKPDYVGVVMKDPRPQFQVAIAYPAPSGRDGQEAARDVLTAMLNIRLGAIRTKLGSTYGTYARRLPAIGPSAYVMGGGVDTAKGAESLAAMRDAVDSLRRGDDFDRDFATARRMVLKRLLAESTDTMSLFQRLSNIATYNLQPDFYDQQVRFVAAVSPAQVRDLIKNELPSERETIVIMSTRDVLDKTFAGAGITTVRYVEPD